LAGARKISPAPEFAAPEGWEDFIDGGAHGVDSSSGGLSGEMLEYGKGLFDGVQVG
jgi:hypothetical protein